jgi:hypothetical protein
MKRCIAFFNFGNKCILELLVATYSLRKHYDGEIVWLLANNDDDNKKLSEQATNLRVNIVWTDFSYIKRNTKSAIKPSLFKKLFSLGYESVIMCDGDLLFLKPIEELWKPLEANGVVLTQFCNWKTNGKIMWARISQMKGILDDYALNRLSAGYPAINIGVMGFTNKATKSLDIWENITSKLAGKHIADEIAAHALIVSDEASVPYIATSSFNASAKIGDLSHIENNHVVHYHGGAQGGGEAEVRYEHRRRSSRLWLAYLYEFYASGIVPQASMWEQYATGGVYKILQSNPNLPFECYKEFIK